MSELSPEDSSLELIASGADPNALLAAIEAKPELWKQNTWRQNEAGGQQDTQAIMLMWADGNSFERIRDSVSVVPTPALAELGSFAAPLIAQIVRATGAQKLGRIFIVKLKPGGRVYPHADVGTYADSFERFHLCLQADPEFTYFVQHPTGPIQYANMKPGELYWFNHKRVHWAHNGGSHDRISIIFDAVCPTWHRQRDTLAVGVGYQYQGGVSNASV